MNYTPPKDNKTIIIISGLLFAIASVCFVCSSDDLAIGYPFIWQLLAITIFVSGIQIFTRYYTKTYTYTIDESGTNTFSDEFNRISELNGAGGLWIKIACIQGKKSTVVGGFPVSAVYEFVKGKAGDIKDGKSIRHGFNFCNRIFSKDCYTAAVILNGDKISVTFEPNEEMIKLFERRNIE